MRASASVSRIRDFHYDFEAKSLKTAIEYKLFKTASKYLKNPTVSTVTGKPVIRTLALLEQHLKPANTIKVVELNKNVYDYQVATCSRVQSKVALINDTVENHCNVQFIDADLTATHKHAGPIIENVMYNQIELQKGIKAFTFTMSMRGDRVNKNTTLKFIQENLLQPITGTICEFTENIRLKDTFTPNQWRTFKKEAGGVHPSLNKIDLVGSYPNLLGFKMFSYNAGGGPMITGIIIHNKDI